MPTIRAQLSPVDVGYFLEVVQVRNISRAAERLGISQPSLSAAVQRLERRLGVDLLIRGKAGVEVTRAGASFASRAKALLGEWQGLESVATRHVEEPSGRFRIGCHVSVALEWLPQAVSGLLQRWPRLELELVHDLSRNINDLVASHQLDFGLVVNPIRHPDLVVLEIARDVFTFWGREQELSSTLLFDPDLLQAQALRRRIEKRGISFARTVTSSSLEIIAALAARGVGTAILPTHLAKRTRPALQRCRGKLPEVQDTVCLVYRADAQRSPGARRLIAGLKAASSKSMPTEDSATRGEDVGRVGRR